MLNKSKSNYQAGCLLLWKTEAPSELVPGHWEGEEWALLDIQVLAHFSCRCPHPVSDTFTRDLLTCRDRELTAPQTVPSPNPSPSRTGSLRSNSTYPLTMPTSLGPLCFLIRTA